MSITIALIPYAKGVRKTHTTEHQHDRAATTLQFENVTCDAVLGAIFQNLKAEIDADRGKQCREVRDTIITLSIQRS